MNLENRPYLALAAILIVGAIAGFLVKSALKAKVTSSPDDRKITAIHQTYDFKAAQDRAEQQAEQASQDQIQPGDVQPGTGAPTPTPTPGQ